jgi:CO/xanthine dehydrogenase FAD-binding subunit
LSLLFKPKSYLVPKDEAELSTILKECGEKARIIAGGTGIYEIAHRGLLSEIEALVDIRDLGLSYVKRESTSIRIGAATTMTNLFHSQELRNEKKLQAITDALSAIQPLQVKNVATIAGAICTALPFFDLPVALLALGATVKIGLGSKSAKPLSDFIKGYFAIDLSPGEFVREIEIPIDGNKNISSAFQKFAITHDDWALINCGVCVSLDKSRGEVTSSMIVFGGGVGERPVRATNVEKSLEGMKIESDESKFKEIFEREIPKDLEPISDIRSSAEYRMRLAKVIGRRTFLVAVNRA